MEAEVFVVEEEEDVVACLKDHRRGYVTRFADEAWQFHLHI